MPVGDDESPVPQRGFDIYFGNLRCIDNINMEVS
jgi:hypothetical protein